MITVLCTNAYKAAKAVYTPAGKLPKHLRSLPVLHTMKLYTHEGRAALTQVIFDPKTETLQPVTEYISARIDAEFETCVPAKAFTDWLRATLPDKHDKAIHASEQIKLWMNPPVVKGERERLYIQQGKTTAMFYCLSASEFPAINA